MNLQTHVTQISAGVNWVRGGGLLVCTRDGGRTPISTIGNNHRGLIISPFSKSECMFLFRDNVQIQLQLAAKIGPSGMCALSRNKVSTINGIFIFLSLSLSAWLLFSQKRVMVG